MRFLKADESDYSLHLIKNSFDNNTCRTFDKGKQESNTLHYLGCYDCAFGGQICCELDDGTEECRYKEDCPTYEGMQKPQFGEGILFFLTFCN